MGVTISQTAANLVITNFVGKDFDTYVSQIQGFILARFGPLLYNNFNASDTGQCLLEAVSYALANAAWLVDRQAGECYIQTVEIPTNAARLTRLVGYKPAGAVPSAGNVQITLGAIYPFTVTIPAGTQLIGTGGLIYQTSSDVSIPPGSVVPVIVGVVEGQTIQETFTSDGTAGQVFNLSRVPNGMFIAQGSADVVVAGVDWPTVNFIGFSQTNQVEIAYAESPPTMRFGDGIAGNIPPSGASIVITYLATHGAGGSAQPGTINSFRVPIVVNFTNISVVVTNLQATGVGSNTESLSKTQALAPQVFASAQRAVSVADYTAQTQAFVDPHFGAVAVGQAVPAKSIAEDAETQSILANFQQLATSLFGPLTPTQQAQFDALSARLSTHWNDVLSAACQANLISVQVLQMDVDGRLIAPNVGLVNALQTYLNSICEATVFVSVTDGSVNLFPVNTSVEVIVAAGFNQATVLAAVQTAVNNYLLNKTFGQAAYLGDVYATINPIQGVAHTNVQFTAPAALFDQFGNIITAPYQVLTLGTTTVTAITS